MEYIKLAIAIFGAVLAAGLIFRGGVAIQKRREKNGKATMKKEDCDSKHKDIEKRLKKGDYQLDFMQELLKEMADEEQIKRAKTNVDAFHGGPQ